MQSGNGTEDRIVVGYFADGADALRAINELIDEGFRASDIGAAFRTRGAGGTGMSSGTSAAGGAGTGITGEALTQGHRTEDLTPAGDRNPAVTGSVGGAGSHDHAVQPAGLAPGSGNAFPAPSRPGPIPGGEVPSTLKHELPSTMKHELPSTMGSSRDMETEPVPMEPAMSSGREPVESGAGWGHHLRHVWGQRAGSETTGGARRADDSSMKFGTGEGHLDLSSTYDYSEPSFETSFLGMGLGAEEARSLSAELSRGGAVISVTPGGRDALVEGIIERNHGQLRFESASTTREPMSREPMSEDRRVELYGSMQNYYRPEDDLRTRKAS